MTMEHQVNSNDRSEGLNVGDRGDSNPNLCLASIAGDKNAFNSAADGAHTAGPHLPDLSIDFGDSGDSKTTSSAHERRGSGERQAHHGARRASGGHDNHSGTVDASTESATSAPAENTTIVPIETTASSHSPGDPVESTTVVTPQPSTDTGGAGTIDGFTVGIDGHSDWYGSSYDNLSAQQTIDAVKNMGLGVYAFDVNADNPKNDELIAAAKQDGIGLIGSIGAAPSSFDNAQDAYDQSYNMAAQLGTEYGSGIKTWQLANETDAWAMASPQNFQIAESEMQGLTAGLKSTDPSAETMINTTNGATGGEFLNQLKADGVNWDITGYHAYTQAGDVAGSGETTLADVAALGKPIYISELNGWTSGDQGPSQLPNNPELLTNSLDSIRSVAKQDDIIGVNFYELLNQPEISGSEGGFGVLNADGSATASSNAITAYMQANSNG